MAEPPTMRVLTGKGYPIDFCVDLGQRGVRFERRELRPRRFFKGYNPSAICGPTGLGYDLIHTWNAVPVFPLKPFLVTFEATFPRVWDEPRQRRMRRWLIDRLRSRRCASILALSEYAVRMFRNSNAGNPALPELEGKLSVCYPAIEVRRSQPRRPHDDAIHVCFVGREFLRKGGAAVTRAHAKLRRSGVPVKTWVVSSLGWSPSDYSGPRAGFDIEAEYARLNQDGLTHVRQMANAQVKELFAQVDFCVLPTVHDTFGFALLEAMTCGTPVIASDTCAIAEIVEDGRSGHLLPMPVDPELRQWAWIYRREDPGFNAAFAELMDSLGESLAQRLARCWETRRATYERLSLGAVERVRERFNRDTQRERLERLYAGAVGRA